MNRWFHAVAAGLVLAMAACSDRPATITGAGATFPFPLYARWAEAYYGETQIRINYQPIGSSGGIRQIRTKTVDFGATDAPLTGENLRKEGLVQFPVVIGGIVPVYNIDATAEPTGAPSPLLKQTDTVSKCSRPFRRRDAGGDDGVPETGAVEVHRSGRACGPSG